MSTRPKKKQSRSAATRRALVDAARSLVATQGASAVNVADIARIAGVNRSTAYEHFPSREALLRETIDSVGALLCDELFLGPKREREYLADIDYQQEMLEKFCLFLMDRPELARAWLFDVLDADDRHEDKLWSRWNELALKFARSERLQTGLDVEVLSVAVIGALFVWALWARPKRRSATAKRAMARRFARAIRGMSVSGVYQRAHAKRLAKKL